MVREWMLNALRWIDEEGLNFCATNLTPWYSPEDLNCRILDLIFKLNGNKYIDFEGGQKSQRHIRLEIYLEAASGEYHK